MTVIYVDDSEKRKRQEAALAWIAAGWDHGELECKTVGYFPPRREGHHCPACWMNAAVNKAKEALK